MPGVNKEVEQVENIWVLGHVKKEAVSVCVGAVGARGGSGGDWTGPDSCLEHLHQGED